jgi:hypothetical protein
MKIYAFDVDETLELSGGPIKVSDVLALKKERHVIGICGNWAQAINVWPEFIHFVSFIGPMSAPKDQFLEQLRVYLVPLSKAEELVMVGNILGVSGASDDQGAAERAGVRFISEKDFAEGLR